MAKSIKGTQTEKNLLTSFAGESQARMRYTYFASVAKKEGYEQISAIFTETADQEKEHAKRMFKFLEGGMVEITASYPAGVIGTTLENLRAAAAGEHEEWSLDYPHFADVAEQEGFLFISDTVFVNGNCPFSCRIILDTSYISPCGEIYIVSHIKKTVDFYSLVLKQITYFVGSVVLGFPTF